jgi:hypothetical protein
MPISETQKEKVLSKLKVDGFDILSKELMSAISSCNDLNRSKNIANIIHYINEIEVKNLEKVISDQDEKILKVIESREDDICDKEIGERCDNFNKEKDISELSFANSFNVNAIKYIGFLVVILASLFAYFYMSSEVSLHQYSLGPWVIKEDGKDHEIPVVIKDKVFNLMGGEFDYSVVEDDGNSAKVIYGIKETDDEYNKKIEENKLKYDNELKYYNESIIEFENKKNKYNNYKEIVNRLAGAYRSGYSDTLSTLKRGKDLSFEEQFEILYYSYLVESIDKRLSGEKLSGKNNKYVSFMLSKKSSNEAAKLILNGNQKLSLEFVKAVSHAESSMGKHAVELLENELGKGFWSDKYYMLDDWMYIIDPPVDFDMKKPVFEEVEKPIYSYLIVTLSEGRLIVEKDGNKDVRFTLTRVEK